MSDLNSKDLNSINLNLSDYKSSDFIYKDSTCNVKIQLNFFFFFYILENPSHIFQIPHNQFIP